VSSIFSPFYSPSTSLDRSLPLLLLRSLDTEKKLLSSSTTTTTSQAEKRQVSSQASFWWWKENLGGEKAGAANSIKL